MTTTNPPTTTETVNFLREFVRELEQIISQGKHLKQTRKSEIIDHLSLKPNTTVNEIITMVKKNLRKPGKEKLIRMINNYIKSLAPSTNRAINGPLTGLVPEGPAEDTRGREPE